MKYELIPKDVLDVVCLALKHVYNFTEDANIKSEVDRAYNIIQRNRTQCNVKPEDGT